MNFSELKKDISKREETDGGRHKKLHVTSFIWFLLKNGEKEDLYRWTYVEG